MGDDTFAGILRSRNPELHRCLEDMRRRAEDEWVHLLQPDHGSHSGLIHLRNVERNAEKLVPAGLKPQFRDGEIFLLLASVLLHDLGRILPDRKRREIVVRWADPSHVKQYTDAANRKGWRTKFIAALSGLYARRLLQTEFAPPVDLLPEKLEFRMVERSENSPEPCLLLGRPCSVRKRRSEEQKTHACRSQYLIRKYWSNFCLPDEQIAELCGIVTFCHQLDAPPKRNLGCAGVRKCANDFSDTSLEPYGAIRVPLLAAILRIADETEDSWTRAIRQHWYEQYLRVDPGSMYKAFRRGVADVEFCPEAECIIMHLRDDEHDDLAAKTRLLTTLRRKVDDTRRALRSWSTHLSRAGIRYTHVFVQQGGRLYLYPPPSQPSAAEDLDRAAESLEKEIESPHGLQSSYLQKGAVRRYLRQIARLALGTGGFEHFAWSSVEGAIGEPLDGRIKWIILRMGNMSPDLRITPIAGSNRLEIILSEKGALALRSFLAPKPATRI